MNFLGPSIFKCLLRYAIKILESLRKVNGWDSRRLEWFVKVSQVLKKWDNSPSPKLHPECRPLDVLARKNAEELCAQGVLKAQRQDYRGAIADYNQALLCCPTYEVAYYERGIVRSVLGEYHKAIEDFNQAILLDSNFGAAYYERGFARFQLGDDLGAIEDYNQGVLKSSW
jgi:tetratricopeptide (TPR) repeat protein